MARLVDALAPPRLGKGFRLLLASSWASNLGDGIALAAGPLLIAAHTDRAMLVALAGIVSLLPQLLFGLLAGALADRTDRKRIVIAGNVARVAMLAVLVATITLDRVSITVVLVALFCLGSAETFVDASSRTLMPMLVPRKDLGVANSRMMAPFIVANELAGPPLGAFLFTVGMALPWVGLAVMVTFAAGIVRRLRLPPLDPPTTRRHIARDVLDGVVWTWRHRAVRTLAITIVSFNVTWGAAWAVLVLYAEQRLGMSDIGFGLLTTASAIGGLVSTVLYSRIERRVPLATIMRVCLTAEVLMHLAFALTTRAWVALLLMGLSGVYAFTWGTVSGAVRQRAVPPAYQGRVGSVYSLSIFAGILVGRLLGGAIADRWGVAAPFWFAFLATIPILLAVWKELGYVAHADAPP